MVIFTNGTLLNESDIISWNWEKSIAVLSFVKMSAEDVQEYFCDDLSETIL